MFKSRRENNSHLNQCKQAIRPPDHRMGNENAGPGFASEDREPHHIPTTRAACQRHHQAARLTRTSWVTMRAVAWPLTGSVQSMRAGTGTSGLSQNRQSEGSPGLTELVSHHFDLEGVQRARLGLQGFLTHDTSLAIDGVRWHAAKKRSYCLVTKLPAHTHQHLLGGEVVLRRVIAEHPLDSPGPPAGVKQFD